MPLTDKHWHCMHCPNYLIRLRLFAAQIVKTVTTGHTGDAKEWGIPIPTQAPDFCTTGGKKMAKVIKSTSQRDLTILGDIGLSRQNEPTGTVAEVSEKWRLLRSSYQSSKINLQDNCIL